jgi:hypothetical protein
VCLCSVYGIPLDQLMATREKGRDVPTIIEKATEWIIMNGTRLPHARTHARTCTEVLNLTSVLALSHEGIFRKAGRLDSIEDLKDLFNQGLFSFSRTRRTNLHGLTNHLPLVSRVRSCVCRACVCGRACAGKAIEFSKDEDPYVVAGTMNHFLMELPDPILTNAMYDLFIDSVSTRPHRLLAFFSFFSRKEISHFVAFQRMGRRRFQG